MMVSLYRHSTGGAAEYRAAFDRDGVVVVHSSTFSHDGNGCKCAETGIGPMGRRTTDRRLHELLRSDLSHGYSVLYGYVPPQAAPKTSRFLRIRIGIAVVPEASDQLSVLTFAEAARTC